MSSLYAVISDGHSGLDEGSTEIFYDPERAVAFADNANRDATTAGVPIQWRVFVLRELTESGMWEWGLRRPGERAYAYVSERAARNSRSGDSVLVRRRLGTEEWVEVTGDA